MQLAVPSIISNITVPLLGLVDVAIVGHIGDAAYIGAIAVSSMLFNVIYWLFGFLRMGTSGMTSQALGRRDFAEIETPTGIKYVNLRLTKRMVIGVRESSGKEFTINLDELYDAYLHCLRFTSPEVKRRIFMGHSPAVVLLKLLKEKASANP